MAAAVAALKSLKIPGVSLEPETDKISVTEGTPDRTNRSGEIGKFDSNTIRIPSRIPNQILFVKRWGVKNFWLYCMYSMYKRLCSKDFQEHAYSRIKETTCSWRIYSSMIRLERKIIRTYTPAQCAIALSQFFLYLFIYLLFYLFNFLFQSGALWSWRTGRCVAALLSLSWTVPV